MLYATAYFTRNQSKIRSLPSRLLLLLFLEKLIIKIITTTLSLFPLSQTFSCIPLLHYHCVWLFDIVLGKVYDIKIETKEKKTHTPKQ
jgi:hypothetical protein